MRTHEDYHETDYSRRSGSPTSTWFIPGTHIEVIREPASRGEFRHVLFDFDGTLSLIREGWPDVMIPLMVEVLLDTPNAESEAEIEHTVREFVADLTGKQTIYQMIRLAEEVRRRGGIPRDPVEYKRLYLDRLMLRIRDRREALRTGRVGPEEMLVPGSIGLLQCLQKRECSMYLASGTDIEYVIEEAALLGLESFFGKNIFGATDDYMNSSKQAVIRRILDEHQLDGARLLGFGDGYVEIDNVKSVGGTAVGVASDEAGRSGEADAWKRERLIGVGADVIVPDFREHEALIEYLFPG